MCLKGRANKNQAPRIVALIGSPLKIDKPEELFKLARTLRKHNVAVDIISFGESAQHNTPFLEQFVRSADREGNSNLLSVPAEACPPGGLSSALFSSPIVSSPEMGQASSAPPQGGEPGAAAPAANRFEEYGGVNPEVCLPVPC